MPMKPPKAAAETQSCILAFKTLQVCEHRLHWGLTRTESFLNEEQLHCTAEGFPLMAFFPSFGNSYLQLGENLDA